MDLLKEIGRKLQDASRNAMAGLAAGALEKAQAVEFYYLIFPIVRQWPKDPRIIVKGAYVRDTAKQIETLQELTSSL